MFYLSARANYLDQLSRFFFYTSSIFKYEKHKGLKNEIVMRSQGLSGHHKTQSGDPKTVEKCLQQILITTSEICPINS